MEEKAHTGRKEVKGLPDRGTSALHLLLSTGCCEFGYSAQRKRWEPYHPGMRATCQSWASRAAAFVHRVFFSHAAQAPLTSLTLLLG